MQGVKHEASKLPKVGVPEFESGTSSLSATRSNQLSYAPGKEVPYSKSGDPAVKGPSMVFNRLTTGSQASKAGIFSRFEPAAHPPRINVGKESKPKGTSPENFTRFA